MKTEIAQKAAKWWADHLRHGSKFDNGDDSETGAITMMMSVLLNRSRLEQRPADDANKFENALSSQLLALGEKKYLCFGVDYGPDYFLCQAADKAGIELGMSDLPWKTRMWIREDVVKVAEGYGKSPVEI